MARTNRPAPAKVPDPREKNTIAYFDNTGDGGIRCVGAAMSISSQCHIIICAPDVVALKEAWAYIAPNTPLDLKKSQVMLYRYGNELDKLQTDQVHEMQKQLATSSGLFWYYNNGVCFLAADGEGDGQMLGLAVEQTEDECKVLMRNCRIPRSEIQNAVFKIKPDDPPPVVKTVQAPGYYWYYRVEDDTCIVDYEYSARNGLELIGKCNKLTRTDCVHALKRKGWSDKDIREVKIDPMDPIPF